MAERSFKQEVEKLKLGDGAEFHGEGILAVTKALLQSGVSYVAGYQGAPISHLMDVHGRRQRHPGRARRAFRESAQRGDGCGDAGGLGELSAARRGHLQVHGRHQCRLRCACQSRLRRRDRRRARHHRRGLWRRLLDHAGARPRLRHEIADVAARSAAEPAVDRARGGDRLRAVGGLEHAGDADAAHPRLPRLRAIHHQDQQARRVRPGRRAGAPAARSFPHRHAADDLCPRKGQVGAALAVRR